jgi:hypothetical protein
MKYLNLTKQVAALAIGALVFASCTKVEVPGSIGDAGQTLVKILGGGGGAGTAISVASKPIDFVSTPTKILALEVRRDIPNPTELNTTMHVTVKDDLAAVTAAGRTLLPAAWYTIGAETPRTGGVGGNYNITMAPGEFSKSLYITVPDATLMDPSVIYALGFTITAADDNGVISYQKSIIVEIGAKNPYDGIYSYVSGLVTRYTAPGVPAGDALSGPLGPANPDIVMSTTGARTVDFGGAGGPVGLTWSGPMTGVAGIDGLHLTVDPATNLTNAVSSGLPTSNATFGNWAGHVNKYDPATRTFTLAFRWNPATTTREYEVVLKYKGPR